LGESGKILRALGGDFGASGSSFEKGKRREEKGEKNLLRKRKWTGGSILSGKRGGSCKRTRPTGDLELNKEKIRRGGPEGGGPGEKVAREEKMPGV